MTKQEAQIRNNKIMQFRGTALRIKGMIPDDIWDEIGSFDRTMIIEAHRAYERVVKILDSKAKCRHRYYEEYKMVVPRCCICGHAKYSRDGLGKAKWTKKNGENKWK